MIRDWTLESSDDIANAGIFTLRSETWRSPRDCVSYPFSVIDSHDWVNIIALTDDQQVVMVRQFRVGNRKVTLEIPGGGVELGEDPLHGAQRELAEETGFVAPRWTALGWCEPNPAMQNNRCHAYLAEGAYRAAEPSPDGREDLEVELVPLVEIPRLIWSGEISHVLVAHAFQRHELLRRGL